MGDLLYHGLVVVHGQYSKNETVLPHRLVAILGNVHALQSSGLSPEKRAQYLKALADSTWGAIFIADYKASLSMLSHKDFSALYFRTLLEATSVLKASEQAYGWGPLRNQLRDCGQDCESADILNELSALNEEGLSLQSK